MINTTIKRYTTVLVRISLGTIKYEHGQSKLNELIINFVQYTCIKYYLNRIIVIYTETEIETDLYNRDLVGWRIVIDPFKPMVM